MDWFANVDLYCERTAPGLLGEPLNALSNLAFLAAAALAWRDRRRLAVGDAFVAALIGLVAVMGLGSLAFHTFANRWALQADVVPITAFIYAYYFFALRNYLGAGAAAAALWTAALFGAAMLTEAAFPGALNGSIAYLPGLLTMAAIGAIARRRGHPAGRTLLAASGWFAVALVPRTLDRALCAGVPIGTHFLWHALNGVVFYLLLAAALRHAANPAGNENRPRGPADRLERSRSKAAAGSAGRSPKRDPRSRTERLGGYFLFAAFLTGFLAAFAAGFFAVVFFMVAFFAVAMMS